MSGIMLLFEDSRGVYIPRDYAQEIYHKYFTGYMRKDVDELERIGNTRNPTIEDMELYHEIWDRVLQNAEHVDQDGHAWHLEQDMDVFLVCPELMTEQEKMDFYGENELEELEERREQI